MITSRGRYRPRRFRSRLRLLAPMLLTLMSCKDLTSGDLARINQWLTCIECSEGELNAVLKLAEDKPEATTDSLGAALLRGPTPQERDNLRRQFAAVYQQLANRFGAGNVRVPQSAYVDHYLQNVIAIYRIRAARALAQIQGGAAKNYLVYAQGDSVRAHGDTLRPDVIRAIFIADSAFNP